ncbi:MAG: ABC transporter permease subunit [Pseudomonadota bacterium]
MNDYANPWSYRLQWAYMLLVVATLMTPVFYVMYVSFNENGFGAAEYVFTTEWYGVVFGDKLMMNALGWTVSLAICTTLITVPFAVLSAKFYKNARNKLPVLFLLMLPLFVAPDIFGSALLVYFKNLNFAFQWLGDQLGTGMFDAWFRLGFMTALIGLVIYTIPYAFIVVLITMGRYREEQTEAARSCGASSWRAFWDIEFPQIRPGVASSCAFTVILCFNEYTRTSLLKGGFDTFTTVLVSQMLNTGMSEQSYAMSAMVSYVAIALIGGIILWTLVRSDKLGREARAKAEPVAA